MNGKEIIEAIKNFFLDIIGFFLPGFILLILLSICISPSYFISTTILKSTPSYYNLITIVVSYILGYVIYGIGIIKDEILDVYSSTNKIENGIATLNEFSLALNKYNTYISTHSLGNVYPATISTSNLRNLIFSFLSNEEKNTIYTFMFRSDLCKHLYTICAILGFLGWINFGLNRLLFEDFKIFLLDTNSLILYSILIVSAFLFRKTRNYFYRIAIQIPFGMYISK